MAQKYQDSDSLSWMLRCTIYFLVLSHSGNATCGAPSGMLWNPFTPPELFHSLLYYRKPKGRISLACWKSEAYFAHLSSDFPSSKWTQGAIW
jgi:hypothetical protein